MDTKIRPEEVQWMEAVSCALLKFRKEQHDFICIYANKTARDVLGDAAGRTWEELNSTRSLPIKFDQELLNFPNGKTYRVVKKAMGEENFLFTLVDISMRHQAAKEIEDFLFIASHDLQEPLRKIISFGERIGRNRQVIGEENNLYLSRMMSATGRMQTMLSGLLSFSRIGRVAMPYTDCDLSEIVHDAYQAALQITEGKSSELITGELPVIEAVKSQMLFLFQELFVNALKFQTAGSTPRITVESEVSTDKKNVQIRVTDNGIGFDESNTERIFMLFNRLNGRAEYEGAGLGLPICRKIVESHSGEIKARSSSGKGTTLEITLPMDQESEQG